MILATHSDASDLSETRAQSRAGGHFFLTENDEVPRNNRAVLTLAQIIKSVMSSATETELGALYINAREAIPIRHLLEELGHTQPPTPIQIDNSTELDVVSNIIQTQMNQGHGHEIPLVTLSTHIGTQEQQTWPTMSKKHHAPIHHRTIHALYLTDPTKLAHLQAKNHETPYPIKHIRSPLPTILPSASAA
eukprot:CCRYP_005117-RB/>CCRYP_005117-RB protein AED:0.50 eAED:0.42 QI:0/0/0/1/0/0/2/0/190